MAYAAQRLGRPARIFVPTCASPAKLELIRACGATLVISGDRYADALEASQAWAAGSGALEVHAFDQEETLLGQGTLGLELAQQAPSWTRSSSRSAAADSSAASPPGMPAGSRVIGVEPEEAPTLTRALAAGEPVDAPAGGYAADSLAPRRVGERVFPLARDYVARTVLVTDEAIRAAQLALWRRPDRGGARRRGGALRLAQRPLPAGRRRTGRRGGERRQHRRRLLRPLTSGKGLRS